MFSLFSRSRSHSRGRYPDPNRGGSYYQRGSFFGRFGSFSGSSGRGRAPYYPHENQNPAPYQPVPPAQAASAVCPNCGTSVPTGSKFCLSCGAKINNAAFCHNCGKPLPLEAKFCPECGTPRHG